MRTIVEYGSSIDDIKIEYEVLQYDDSFLNEQKAVIDEGLASIEEQLGACSETINELNSEIDTLTNNADWIDNIVAVSSGIIAGLVDIFFVGEFSLENAQNFGNMKADQIVVKVAQVQGYTGNDVVGAIEYLEEKNPIAADKATNSFGGGLQHHLRDFSHHPTIVGLIFSMLTQFTGCVYGTDTAGMFCVVKLSEADMTLIGKNLPEKITFGVINWFFHMVSDMAGSSSSRALGKMGTGIPGPIVSLLKELSALPIFKNLNEKGYKEFSVWISKLFNGTLLGTRFDLRTEIGVLEHMGKQAIPVLINECVVRGFYFVRRLHMEIVDKQIKGVEDLGKIDWKKTAPFKNRTVVRMLTIATGTMTAVDMADAAIEGAIKSGETVPGFVSQMLVRVNFVGLGRFVVAAGTDVYMGGKRQRKINERIEMTNKYIYLLEGKVFYKQASMWIEAEQAGESIEKLEDIIGNGTREIIILWGEINESMRNIGRCIPQIEEKNPGLIDDMLDILEWG